MRNIHDFIQGRDNNFNLLRLLFAMLVVVEHYWLVTVGYGEPVPFTDHQKFTIGAKAVNGFFILSGFLVTQSLVRSRDLADYAAARMLRIMPALLVMILFTALILGPAVTKYAFVDYVTNAQVWIYISLVSSMIEHEISLPGVFGENPAANLVNASIWTIRLEVLAYCGLLLVMWSGFLRSFSRFNLFFLIALFAYLVVTIGTDLRQEISFLAQITRFGFCFTLGMAGYYYSRYIRLHLGLVLMLWVLVFLFRKTELLEFFSIIAIAYSIFWFGYVPAGRIRYVNRLGDFSYGIYIYGFPVQQTAYLLLPGGASVWLLGMVSIPVIVALGALSYFVIERPALGQRRNFATMLRRLGLVYRTMGGVENRQSTHPA